MKTRRNQLSLLVLFSIVIMAFMPGSEKAKKPIYLNPAYSFKERAADLVSRMTPEEKQSQLGNTMAPIPRLGVNHYDIWGEALHGIMGRNNNSGMTATSFPNSVAVGATWDPELIKRETKVISDEARGFNHNLIFTLTYWSPVIEPARDPRWGRTAETFGEDPFLVSQIGKGFIQGLMGDDPVYLKAVPCGKHYFANNTEFNRHNGSADMDDRDMREYYLLPYRTLIRDYKLPSIMTAYSAVNGIPVSASKYLVDTIARKTYGLDGYVTGDCGAIDDMVRGHNYAENHVVAAALGIKAGVDTDCGSVYQANALEAVRLGILTEAEIDRALVNFFTIRMRMGEFDPREIVPYAGIKPGIINDPSHNDLALEVATKTPVLLKNSTITEAGGKALPIDLKRVRKIAVLGPQADKVELGDYSGEVEPHLSISPLEGMQNYIKEHNLNTEIVSVISGNTDRKTDFLTVNRFSTVRNGEVLEEYDATQFSSSAPGLIVASRYGWTVISGIKDGDWTAYDNIDITNIDSIRFNLSSSADGGILEVRVGSAAGNVLASERISSPPDRGGFPGWARPRVVSVKINTLGITGPQTLVLVYREAEKEIDAAALDLAAGCDVALVFVGTDQSTGREESDRFALTLPGNQNELIKAVAAINPNTIVVMQTMGMVEVEQFKNLADVTGIIWTGYNGQAQGTAMAKILFGDVNPGGKLNVTWHKSLNDLPDFNDYSLRGDGTNGRTYMYFNKDVSYEFGYGLSYTTFAYSNFAISKTSITPNDKITLSVDVQNTGTVDGEEVVQVYVKTPDSHASLERPIKRLKGFKRVMIPRGQVKTVTIDINCEDLWFWDSEKGKITFDPGRYIFEIGASSRDIKGEVEARMSGTYKPVLTTVVAGCGRVVLRPGDVVQTSVTASMSDDSFYDITKAGITFKSNNPGVAAVDEKGRVTATGVGVASIFAYVTIDGTTVSNSYPVKVMRDLNPGSVKVNGKRIPGFDKEVKAYSYLLKSNSKIPVVKAEAPGSGVSVEIEQARAIPGTATVQLIDNVTLEKNVYYLNFDTESVSDEFNGGTVDPRWKWVRENKSTRSLSVKPGSLTITGEPGGVLEATNNARNLLLQSANNDWTIETRLVCSRSPSQPENAGILAYQDDDNFVKLMFRAVVKTTRVRGVQPGTIDLVMEENGIAKSLATFNLRNEVTGDNALSLKLEKRGSIYTAYYSLDGTNWELLGTASLLLKDIRAGLIVCDGTVAQYMKSTFWFDSDTTKPDTPFDVSFDYFRIKNSGLK